VYSYVSGFGVLLLMLLTCGFFLVGWRGVLAFVAARGAAGLVNWAVEFWNARRIKRATGFSLWSSELNFFNAYRLHAAKLGRPTEIEPLQELEIERENWNPCFEDLAGKWPAVVRRFTVE
jgi:hypothetical protein